MRVSTTSSNFAAFRPPTNSLCDVHRRANRLSSLLSPLLSVVSRTFLSFRTLRHEHRTGFSISKSRATPTTRQITRFRKFLNHSESQGRNLRFFIYGIFPTKIVCLEKFHAILSILILTVRKRLCSNLVVEISNFYATRSIFQNLIGSRFP